MKRLEERLGSGGTMIRYISNCQNCPNFLKTDGNARCLQYHNMLNQISLIPMSYIDSYNNEIYNIPVWCGLEDYATYNSYSTSTYKRPEPKKDNKCSYCEEEDNSVERKLNYGMCSKCLGASMLDNTILVKAKLNNFKLKRINKNKYSYNSYNIW